MNLLLLIQAQTDLLPPLDPWKNFSFLFGAYALIFSAIFVYTLLIGARQKRLDKTIERLKAELDNATNSKSRSR